MTEMKPSAQYHTEPAPIIDDERVQAIIAQLELAKAKGVEPTLLGKDEQEKLDAIADLGERQWRRCAEKIHEYRLLNDALPPEYRQSIKRIEIEVAGHRWRANSVRAYYSIWRGVYDEDAGMFDEFPQFGWGHWREIVMYARAHDTKVSDVAIQWARTEDDHGGMVIWPDALSAKLHAQKDDRPPFVRDIARMENNVAQAQRHCVGNYFKYTKEVREISVRIEKLCRAVTK